MNEFFRNGELEATGRGDPSEAAVQVRVPVVRASCDNLEVVLPTVIQLLSALSRSWEPAQLRFVMSAGGAQKPQAEWQVDAADGETAVSVATNLAAIANSVLADIRVGKPQEATPNHKNPLVVSALHEPDDQEADDSAEQVVEPAAIAVADFVASRCARVDYVRGVSSAWRAVREDSVRWQLTIDIDALLSPPADGDSEPADDKVFFPETPTPATAGGDAVGRRAHPAGRVRRERGRESDHGAVQRGHFRTVRSAEPARHRSVGATDLAAA